MWPYRAVAQCPLNPATAAAQDGSPCILLSGDLPSPSARSESGEGWLEVCGGHTTPSHESSNYYVSPCA